MKDVKVMVLCDNAAGVPEFFVCHVLLSEDDYTLGKHYDRACGEAGRNGYTPLNAFDENDEAGQQIVSAFNWTAVPVYKV